jgi:hypothetical protein
MNERNRELERVGDAFVGNWTISLTNQWWLEDPTTVTTGTAAGEWLGESFVRLQAEIDGKPTWDFVFGRSDANDRFVALYHDERGVLRVFDLTIDDDGWAMSRTDPDMHQRLDATFDGDRMVGATYASDDAGATWRKDFDLIWERVR